jgi:uncharacterized protein YjbJ (UPF0337 family)
MDWNQVAGNWKQVRGNVKRHWGKLTDSDLTAIAGRREELEGKIQERYGYTKDRVRKEIEEWYQSLRSELDRSREEWADQLDAIRADLERLSSTVSRVANTQIERAQDKAVEAAQQAGEAVRRNPTSALAIAFGVGFLFGAFTRR